MVTESIAVVCPTCHGEDNYCGSTCPRCDGHRQVIRNTVVPSLSTHWEARCLKCGHPLDGNPIDTERSKGRFHQTCNACDYVTYYDLKSH